MRSPDIDAELRAMVAAGHTYNEIIKTLKVGSARVTAARLEYGATIRPNVPRHEMHARNRKVVALKRQGWPAKDIALHMGISYKHTMRLLRQETRIVDGANPIRFGRAVVRDLEASTQGFRDMKNTFTFVARDELTDWIETLEKSRDEIAWLIKELKQEAQHGNE